MITVKLLGEEISIAPVVLIIFVLSHHDSERHDHVIHTYRIRKMYVKEKLKDVL